MDKEIVGEYENKLLLFLITVNAVKFKQTLTDVSRFKHPARFMASGFLMDRKYLEVEDWMLLYDLLEDYVIDVGIGLLVLGKYDPDLRVRFLRYHHRFLDCVNSH